MSKFSKGEKVVCTNGDYEGVGEVIKVRPLSEGTLIMVRWPDNNRSIYEDTTESIKKYVPDSNPEWAKIWEEGSE